MTAIFGELLSFDQENGPEIRLRVFGDEFYARYETEEGYTVIYDETLGKFTYARLKDGYFVSSGVDLSLNPPSGLEKHLEESDEARMQKAEKRFFRH
ncbi:MULTISPECIES: hypothetical protein [Methanosarcina]|uniref:Uncharacterized protein n=3 Tax=Methanosarcina barkeri TaxID=2208 RepID=A0A0E3LNG6_METBA|nr:MULTISPECIES: hypothetical protein [Methanosarcina]AKB54736.1 hypothetical protein MSBRM_1738 [Methanosarcina barkeri MS]AKB57183.1 hypothetical protein MSBR2_0667 [Methanosarcina barkeri 227]AKJ37744.1 hypothetical protein MCM1_0655 [Methanosarcina barkeri CM1]OED06495.1 hypothetical protein A9239_11575 [Methanosarcina sp. A14]